MLTAELLVEAAWDGSPTATWAELVHTLNEPTYLWFRLNEPSGTLTDSSGGGALAGVTGSPTYRVAGAILGEPANHAIDFTASYAASNVMPLAADLTAFSFFGWLKKSAAPGSDGMIIGSEGGPRLFVDANGKLNLEFFDLNNDAQRITSARKVCTGGYRFVVGTFDGARLNVYLDAVLDGQFPSIQSPGLTALPRSATTDLGIAATALGADPLDAILDEVGFLPGLALTDDQIKALYRSRDVVVDFTWSQIDGVKSVVTGRGRQYETDVITAGVATVISDDVEHLLDSGRDDLPQVTPDKRLRVSVLLAGTPREVWSGELEALPQSYEQSYTETTLTASEAYEALANLNISGTTAQGLSGTVVHALLDLAGWPTTRRQVAAGVALIASQVLVDANALSTIQTVVDSEGPGSLFMIAPNGDAVFQDRLHRAHPTPALTFSDAPGAGIEYIVLSPVTDNTLLVNSIGITPDVNVVGGLTMLAEDQTSIREHQKRSATKATFLTSNAHARWTAEQMLLYSRHPKLRVDAIQINILDDETLDNMLALNISDCVQVDRHPDALNQAGNYVISKLCFVESIAWSIVVNAVWSCTLQLSAVPDFRPILTLNDPIKGRLDAGNVVAVGVG